MKQNGSVKAVEFVERERERERDRDRDRQRQTDRQTDRQIVCLQRLVSWVGCGQSVGGGGYGPVLGGLGRWGLADLLDFRRNG